MNKQNGSGLVNELLSLGLPLGLTILNNKLKKKDTVKKKIDNKTNINNKIQVTGGFLSEKLIYELGLTVVPLSLIGTLELYKDTEKNN